MAERVYIKASVMKEAIGEGRKKEALYYVRVSCFNLEERTSKYWVVHRTYKDFEVLLKEMKEEMPDQVSVVEGVNLPSKKNWSKVKPDDNKAEERRALLDKLCSDIMNLELLEKSACLQKFLRVKAGLKKEDDKSYLLHCGKQLQQDIQSDTVAQLSTRINDEEREKEKIEWAIKEGSVSEEEKKKLKDRLDEVTMLLQALRGNLEAIRSGESQPHINENEVEIPSSPRKKESRKSKKEERLDWSGTKPKTEGTKKPFLGQRGNHSSSKEKRSSKRVEKENNSERSKSHDENKTTENKVAKKEHTAEKHASGSKDEPESKKAESAKKETTPEKSIEPTKESAPKEVHTGEENKEASPQPVAEKPKEEEKKQQPPPQKKPAPKSKKDDDDDDDEDDDEDYDESDDEDEDDNDSSDLRKKMLQIMNQGANKK